MTYWDKITTTGSDFCFVCDKKFKSYHKPVYIGRHKKTGDCLYRHEHCDALSSNWANKFKVEAKKARVKLIIDDKCEPDLPKKRVKI